MDKEQVNEVNEEMEKEGIEEGDTEKKEECKKGFRWNGIFKMIDIHPEVNGVNMKKPGEGTKAEFCGVKSNEEETQEVITSYNHMIDSIKEMMENPTNSPEVNEKLIELLDQIREDIKDLEEKKVSKGGIMKVVGIGVSVITSVATSIGVGLFVKELIDKKDNKKEVVEVIEKEEE